MFNKQTCNASFMDIATPLNLLLLPVCRVPFSEQLSKLFDKQPTYDLLILSNPRNIILTHDTIGWKHIVDLCVCGEKFTTLPPIYMSCFWVRPLYR